MPHCSCRTLGRRSFLTAAGGAAMLGMAGRASAAGAAKALLLSCIDYRLLDSVDGFMKQRGMAGQYDQVILAGAGLGAVYDKKPDWEHTFWDHLAIARKLHGIQEVIVIDHRDCGAFRTFLGEDSIKDPVTETATHERILHRFATRLKKQHPDLSSEYFLMALDGSVQSMSV